MKSLTPLRLGLIGTGTIGRIHLDGIQSLVDSGLLDAEVTAVCDTNEESMKDVAETYGVANIYKDYQNLVQDEIVDVVYICTPTDRHADMVKAAAKAGKAIFCEKPLAHSAPQARDLVAVTQRAEVPAGVGLVLRYDPFVLHAKKLIEKYDFGQPMLAHIRDDQRFPIDYVYRSRWRGERAVSGGGTLIEHSIHDIDILRWFFGEVKEVYAKVSYFTGKEVEDHASLIMTHVDGPVSTLDSVWHWVDRPNERRIEFFFERGYLGIKLESGKRYLEYHVKDNGPVRVWNETADLTLIEELGLHAKNLSVEAMDAITSVGSERYSALSYSFLKAVKSNTIPSPNFIDAVAAHRVVDAAYASANEGQCMGIL